MAPGADSEWLSDHGLGAWSDRYDAHPAALRHGDWSCWREAIDSLPALGAGFVDVHAGAIALDPAQLPRPAALATLETGLQALHPWRKGPYRVCGIHIDTEWRSDWKWERIAPHLDDLAGRAVLDVGCGNGYHCWRTALAGARAVVGIDPTAVFYAQYLAISRLAAQLSPALAARVRLLPVGIEAVPPGLGSFDTVFSMGVLYHRRSPLDHLTELRGALRPGGQLVLETLVVDGPSDRVLVPSDRYAKMRNVWFIPSPGLLENWLRRCGFNAVQTVDLNVTSPAEQRSTAWMRFESLADFLDPADSGRTVEGYPAPVRAVLVAEA
jgi:tRNA (mo5U34)-methyltransferase